MILTIELTDVEARHILSAISKTPSLAGGN